MTQHAGPIGAALQQQAEREQRAAALPGGRKLLDQLSDAELTQLYDRAEQAEAALARVRTLAADMRTWCSPRGLANHYADTLDAALAEPEEPRP